MGQAKTTETAAPAESAPELRELGSAVRVTTHQRNGTIIGRSEFIEGEPMYQVHYETVVERMPMVEWVGEHQTAEVEADAASAEQPAAQA